MGTREYSSLAKWAVDLQDGNGMRTFPYQPADFNIMRISEPDIRLDGQENTPMFWDIELHFNLLTNQAVAQISSWFDPNNQRVRLNYASAKHFSAPATGGADSGWLVDDCIWRDPPLAKPSGTFRAVVLYDLVIPFRRLVWDGATPGSGSSGTGGSSDGGFYNNVPVTWTLSATSITNSQINVAWTNISGPTTGIEFVLFNGLTQVAVEASGTSSYSFTGLTAATSYYLYFLVRDTTAGTYVGQSTVLHTSTIT